MFTILEIRKLSNILTIILAVSLTLSFKADASENSPLKIGDQVFVSTIKKVGTLIAISKGSGKVSLQTADGLEYKLFNLGKLYKKTNCLGIGSSLCYYHQGKQIIVINSQNQIYRISDISETDAQSEDKRDVVETLFDAQSEQILMESRSVLDTW